MVILEAGGAQEEEVDGKIEDLTILALCVIIVAKQAILQPSVMLRDDIRSGKLQQGNYASSLRQDEDRKEHLFVMQHMMNAVTRKGRQDDVWYVDSGASSHMTSHGEWFGEM